MLTTKLVGAPADRQSRLLAAMLRDPDRLLRYLLLLLADDDPLLGGAAGTVAQRWLSRWSSAGWDELPLLELLVRAADRFPDRLDHIERLMHDLGDHGDTVLPRRIPGRVGAGLAIPPRRGGRAMSRFDAGPVLAQLKDFQRATVDTVVDRFYPTDGSSPAHRFLVADEVGLGKTLVARGVIARTIEHLQDEVKRIDVVYVCSNADIARQNVRRLRTQSEGNLEVADRLTMLPVTANEPGRQRHQRRVVHDRERRSTSRAAAARPASVRCCG